MGSRIIIISTGWKCEEYMNRCYKSVDDQGVELIHKVIVDDENNRKGKVFNFLKALSEVSPNDNDIICDLDLDDYLENGAIETIIKTYTDNEKIFLTYGSYRNLSDKPARFNGTYNTNNFRGVKWRASHLKTFRYGLFKNIKIRDLMGANGKYYMTCSDLAFMFPMMEMAGLKRIQHINECLYVYNDLSEYNDHKTWGTIQIQDERWIRKQPKYKEI